MQSVLTDCPDREKGPYTGDNVQNIDTDLTLFDMQAYEGQLVANMRTSQRPNPVSSQSPGLIANIAPEFHAVPPLLFGRNFLDEPNWGGAVIIIPWELHQVYGGTRLMRANYDAMVKWLDYEAATKAAHGGNITGLGDWSSNQHTDPQAVIDWGYYRAASTMAKIARLLGKNSDAAKYSELATSLAAEYNAKYLHTDSAGHAWYANNTEASNAIALDAGLVPAPDHQAVANSLAAAVKAYGYRIGVGSVALGPLFRALHAAGRDDIIYRMVTNPECPSYACLVNLGATTLWENLSGGSRGSKDHHFLGEVGSWLVHGLVGIAQAPDSTGYGKLVIRPAIVGGLAHATGTYTTPQGSVAVSWASAGDGQVKLTATVPANTTAEIWVPTSGKHVTASAGATFARSESLAGVQYAVYNVDSGTYRFNNER
jgi:alpha-L-rhamnosidase